MGMMHGHMTIHGYIMHEYRAPHAFKTDPGGRVRGYGAYVVDTKPSEGACMVDAKLVIHGRDPWLHCPYMGIFNGGTSLPCHVRAIMHDRMTIYGYNT